MTKPQDTRSKDEWVQSFTAMEDLAASLMMRLTLGEIEWLSKALAERAEEGRREAADGRVVVLAGYRDAWEPPMEGVASKGMGAVQRLPSFSPSRGPHGTARRPA